MKTTATESVWWSLLWDSGVVALAMLGPERRYQRVNAAMCRLLEADATTLAAWSYEQVGHPFDLDAELDAFVRLAAGAPAVTYTRRYRTLSGREFSATVKALAGPDDTVLQMVFPGAVQAPAGNAGQLLEQLATALSHDALEPVRQLGVSAGLLQQRLEPLLSTRERDLALLQGMAHNAVRLGRQLRGLVRYARLGTAVIDPAPRPLRALLAAARAQVEMPAAITVHEAVPEDFLVRGDAVQLVAAFAELLRNASAPHAPGRPTTIIISAEQVLGRTLVSVRDDGVGIATADQPRLFRLFAASGPAAGAGVGLALVRAVAQGHGGEVQLESVQGVGTVVHLSLPQ
jgi:signal transduction histidine kinase